MALKTEYKLDNLYKKKSLIIFLISCIFLPSCNLAKEKQQYENQIGDTPFDIELDDPSFKFCDPSDVLHKRAFVRYEGGLQAIQKELINRYNVKSSYESYSGYFIIRLAVNCNNVAGRFRMQILDSNFNLSKCPDELEKHILSIVKELKGWKHPIYNDKDYDGYKFLTIKILNGQIK